MPAKAGIHDTQQNQMLFMWPIVDAGRRRHDVERAFKQFYKK
jgi:hypothetical protein